jgi:peptide/nickel transport system substrate-binding protein
VASDEPVTFTFAHPGPIRTMDAPVTWFGSTHWLANLLYDCLIWRKADGTGYEGQSAESWEQLNPTTWRFKLRPGLTFHNGEPLDAEAVKWNIDRVRTREDFLVQPQWQFVSEVQVVDATTVDVITGEPHAYFESDMSNNGCQILPPKYIEEVGEEQFAREPVGSGPYKLIEFTESERYVFEAWDDYWGGRPEVDRVVYQVVSEQASQIAALLAGQIDMVPNVPLPEREKLGQTPGITLMKGPSNRQHLLYVRDQTESGDLLKTYPDVKLATADKRIRQAISHALDRQVLAEVQGSGRPLLLRVDDYWPEHNGQYAGSEAAINFYDPEKAKALIKEAGYDPDAGNKPVLNFDTPAFQHGNEKEVAEVVKVMLEEVGFTVNLTVLEASAFSEQVMTPGNNRELALMVIGGSPSLTPTFYQCTWNNPAFKPCGVVKGAWEQLGQEILTTTDSDKRNKLWGTWWDSYVDEAVEVTLYHMDQVVAMNDKFEWTPRADGWFTFRDLKIKQP